MTKEFQVKKYLLDGESVTTNELIDAAAAINTAFAAGWLKSTTVAAMILRENGQTVEPARGASQ